jgi:putative flavoprotein involved in K+ transport
MAGLLQRVSDNNSGHDKTIKTRRLSMTPHVNTVIVGAGQAGLAVSHYLTGLSVDHVVLEQADRAGEAWRNHRWDSFTLNTPRWQSRLPGVHYGEDDPDGFMPRNEVVAHFETLARRLPLHFGARVVAIERDARNGGYIVAIDGGHRIAARSVVVATGLYQAPKVPGLSGAFPRDIKQLHSDLYRNPEQLVPGAVLVVGSAQSGAQITEELYESGRKVFLAVGRAGRTPRRYRGKDANWWAERLGLYDRKVSELPSPQAKFAGKPHISGTKGGHTINLHQFARDGVVLLGRLKNVKAGIVELVGDLHDNLAAADRAEMQFVEAVDAYVTATGMPAPEETLPVLRDGFAQPMLTELDLKASGITNVIWATGYGFDFSIVKLPVVDGDGFPMQTRGVSAYPGLFFVGLPWLHTAKSGLIYGVADDARFIADRIAERCDPHDDTPASMDVPQQPGLRQARVRASTRGTCHLGRTILNMARVATSVAAIALAVPSARGAETVNAPAPPHTGILATPASELYLGMREQDARRVLGEAAEEADFATGTETRKLEFWGAIPGEVVFSDGKVSRVTLAVGIEEDALPSFLSKAWPGLAESAVRRVLGEPTDVLHHTFFGINVDQWVFARAGEADVSVFFRDGRVVARAVGRDVPQHLFRVDLPSPPEPESDGPLPSPRLGMMASDIAKLYGPIKFRVDYVVNGQAASRLVFEPRGKGTFVSVTFVDGIATGLDDLGRLPDDPTFQGR